MIDVVLNSETGLHIVHDRKDLDLTAALRLAPGGVLSFLGRDGRVIERRALAGRVAAGAAALRTARLTRTSGWLIARSVGVPLAAEG